MIKLDIINEVIYRTGISTRASRIPSMRGERIELRGFAIFDVRPRKTGIARDLRGGRELAIAPGRVVRFKPGKGLQALV